MRPTAHTGPKPIPVDNREPAAHGPEKTSPRVTHDKQNADHTDKGTVNAV